MLNWITKLSFNEVCDLLLVIGGLSAFILYFVQKHAERKRAATLISGQIDAIDKQLSALREEAIISEVMLFQIKPIIEENMWEKYKHLFVKTLYGSEYDLVQNYFEHAEQLERRRVDIVNTIYSAWKDKSEIEHQIVGNAIFQDSINGSDTREKVEQFRMQFRSMELLFLPDIAINSFRNGVKRFQLLSGTTAYEKLHKISYLK